MMSLRIALLGLLVLGACSRDDGSEPAAEQPVAETAAVAPATAVAATHDVEVVILGMT